MFIRKANVIDMLIPALISKQCNRYGTKINETGFLSKFSAEILKKKMIEEKSLKELSKNFFPVRIFKVWKSFKTA